jgi:membrane protease YdiL (CAAX protease family)
MNENPYQAPLQHEVDYSPSNHFLQERNRPRIWTVFAALATAFCSSIGLGLIVGVALVVVLLSTGTSPNDFADQLLTIVEEPFGFILITGLGQLPFLVTPIIAARLSPVPFRERLGLVPSRLTALQFAVVVFGSAVPFGIGLTLAYALAEVIPADPSTEMLYNNITWASVGPFVAFIALMPGFGEELLFRGYIQRRLLQRWPAWVAICVTSLAFALVHIEPHTVVFALPIGFWLGWVAWKVDSIWPCIVTHAAINGGWNCVVCGVRLTGVEEWPIVPVVVASILGIGASLWAIRILHARQPAEDGGALLAETLGAVQLPPAS